LADAKATAQRVLAAAIVAQVPVLVVLGANWCEDCRALAAAIASGKGAELLAREFQIVKVDVGNFVSNLALVAAYGNPIAKGIPAAVVLASTGQVLYATKAGDLSDARRMNETLVHDFFMRVGRDVSSKR
jgi:protein disulfide-isomerase